MSSIILDVQYIISLSAAR